MAEAGGELTVAISGATGLVGSRLAARLAGQGARVIALTRDAAAARARLEARGVECAGPAEWGAAVARADAVVNLAGEPIATRWSEQLKREIKASRVGVTEKLAAAISAAPQGQRPKVFVSASAVGFYGISQTASFTEDSLPGDDYLAEVCREWEAAAQKVPSDVRVVNVRVGIVIARDGGVIGKMLPIFQLFAGGPLGTGKQWVSWVHRDDLVDLIIEAINNPNYKGAYNGTAPRPVTMGQLCDSVGAALGRPSWLPVPEFALNALLGEGARVVLEGQQVLPARAQQQGFTFKYPTIDAAVRDVVKA